MHLIYYAVEIPSELNRINKIERNSESFLITLVGRKTQSKGQEDAIKALSILVKKNLDVYLRLVGRSVVGYTDYLEKFAQDLEVTHRVEFVSFVNNPWTYMVSADVVLMCSKCEAFGRVTVEAMKLGKALIGSNTGATPELIQDGWNGLIYQAGNAESLAEKIELLYSDKCLSEQMGLNAYTWANMNFHLEKYSSDLLNVFNSVCKKKRRKV